MSLDIASDPQEGAADGEVMGLDMDSVPQEGPAERQVSLDRLADVLNAVLSVPAAEGLALLVRTQLARAASGTAASAEAARPEMADA
ncbi:MAG TPA: hypothetical protein VHL98_02590 [Microvirga sp.]|jgi:ribulose kinase|nr:hypothetical protein [Microvirga sp.]